MSGGGGGCSRGSGGAVSEVQIYPPCLTSAGRRATHREGSWMRNQHGDQISADRMK